MPLRNLIVAISSSLSVGYMLAYVPQRWWWQGDAVQLPFRIVGVAGIYLSALLSLAFGLFAMSRYVWSPRALSWSLLLMSISLLGTVWQMPLWVTGFGHVSMAAECLCLASPPFILALILRQPLVISSFRSSAPKNV